MKDDQDLRCRKEQLEGRQRYRDQLLEAFSKASEIHQQELQAKGKAKADFCASISSRKQEVFKARREAYLAQVSLLNGHFTHN